MLRTVLRYSSDYRNFSLRSSLSKAQVFKMPAMSPTMTEGGIVQWKFKTGNKFFSGDVLLEIETDKATIDVEAQDDGIMWEILEQDGASGIQVGKPIALLAEPGDDLSKLEKPDLSSFTYELQPTKYTTSQRPEAQEIKKSESPACNESSKRQSLKNNSSSFDVLVKAHPDMSLTPAVQYLLRSKDITAETAYANILASGPKGRILKGDVLAYLGIIDSSANARVSSYLTSKEHLDLSNIKIAPSKKADPAKSGKETATSKPSNKVSLEFVLDFEETQDRESFRYAFALSIELAKREAHGARFPNYSLSPTSFGLYSEDIFDDILIASASKDRIKVLSVQFDFQGPSKSLSSVPNEFDELLDVSATRLAPVSHEISLVTVNIDVQYDEKLIDSEEFLTRFQDALRGDFPWKQVVIRN